MKLKCSICVLLSFLIIPLFPIASHISIEANENKIPILNDKIDSSIQALASLTYYVDALCNQSKDGLAEDDDSDSLIDFSDEEVDFLWKKAFTFVQYVESQTFTLSEWINDFEAASIYYSEAQQLRSNGNNKEAFECYQKTSKLLVALWKQATNYDLGLNDLDAEYVSSIFTETRFLRGQKEFTESNPHIHKKIKAKIAPYVISSSHPMKDKLDSIFTRVRATQNEKTFKKAGFTLIGKQRPRSFVVVARHPLLPDYLVKAYYDTDFREKKNKPSWEWLVQRCQGAEKIRHIIKSKEFKYFTVAGKWIYPFPAEPAPPLDGKHLRHVALLLVTDMHLTNKRENHHAWYHIITKEHLDELYAIMSYAGGSSYRPDNINYTKDETFAFMDTEYPQASPDYKKIKKYLRPEMLKYWERLIKKGGK